LSLLYLDFEMDIKEKTPEKTGAFLNFIAMKTNILRQVQSKLV